MRRVDGPWRAKSIQSVWRFLGGRQLKSPLCSIPRHDWWDWHISYIGVVWGVNVGIYSIHGVSGIYKTSPLDCVVSSLTKGVVMKTVDE